MSEVNLFSAVEQRLRDIEVRHDLLQYEVDGWCIWPRLRFWVATTLYELPLSESPSAGYPLRARVRLALRDLPALVRPHCAQHLIKTYSGALMEQAGAHYKDVFFDDLLAEINDFYKLEAISRPSDLPRSEGALTKRDATTALFEILPGVLARVRQPRQIIEVAHSLSDCLRRETGREAFSPRVVLLHLLNFYWSKQLYGRLLDRVRPRYVLTADPGEYAMSAAAKERGVQVLEYQHGFLDRDQHPAYAYAVHAAPYRARMPIPDRLLLYGDYWRQELAANNFWGETLRVVGSVRMDHYRRHRTAITRSDVCTILLTSQGLDVPNLIKFVREFEILAGDRLDYRLIIKLHPVYETSKAIYSSVFESSSRITILKGNESPSTYELLTQAQIHLSISSTCHYDALGLGVPTVILPLATHEIVTRLHEVGHASFVRTPHELVELVQHWPELRVATDVSNYYYTTGALSNIKRELESFL